MLELINHKHKQQKTWFKLVNETQYGYTIDKKKETTMPSFFSTPTSVTNKAVILTSIVATAAAMEFFLAGIDMSQQASWLDLHCNHTDLAQAYVDKGLPHIGTETGGLADIFHATAQNYGFAMEIIRHCNTAAQRCLTNASELFMTDNADHLSQDVSMLGALFNCC